MGPQQHLRGEYQTLTSRKSMNKPKLSIRVASEPPPTKIIREYGQLG